MQEMVQNMTFKSDGFLRDAHKSRIPESAIFSIGSIEESCGE